MKVIRPSVDQLDLDELLLGVMDGDPHKLQRDDPVNESQEDENAEHLGYPNKIQCI